MGIGAKDGTSGARRKQTGTGNRTKDPLRMRGRAEWTRAVATTREDWCEVAEGAPMKLREVVGEDWGDWDNQRILA